MSWENYLEPVELPFELPTSVYGAMLAIWQLRPGLQRKFPLHRMRRHDYLRFLAWCVCHGRKEYAILREITDWDNELLRPVCTHSSMPSRFVEGVNVFVVLVGIAKKRYNIQVVLTSYKIQKSVLEWCRDAGYQELSFNCSSGKGGHMVGGRLFYSKDSSMEHLVRETFQNFIGSLPAKLSKASNNLLEKTVPMPSLGAMSSVMNLIDMNCKSKSTRQLFDKCGVNLFGYARGELGIGEDVRMIARALESVHIPFCIINVQPGSDVSQMDESVASWLVDKPRYDVNLFCMTGIEHVRFIVENGVDVLKKRYTIGLWPWELPEWPQSWHHAYSLVHEIWGISSYTAQSYYKAAIPIRVVPLPVDLGQVSILGRGQFGLPESTYLYYFSFDYNSTMSRKNPEALIEAFWTAFPRNSGQNVGLVLKVSHVKYHHKRWKRFLKLIKSDSRIVIIDKSYRRPDLLALYRCCDCLVSLHRAEGFGRTIVEAILLGKQVVTTGFSGNVDFCDPRRVFLVDFEMSPINKKSYFYAEGQFWAEPNVESAALKMQEAFFTPLAVSSECVSSYSLHSAGALYKEKVLGLCHRDTC